VTFEGCSEGGDQFMARQSYLPNEIHWGFVFSSIIHCAHGSKTRHVVDISKYPPPPQCTCLAPACPLLPTSTATESQLCVSGMPGKSSRCRCRALPKL